MIDDLCRCGRRHNVTRYVIRGGHGLPEKAHGIFAPVDDDAPSPRAGVQPDRGTLKREAMRRLCHTRAHLLSMTLREFTDRYGISYGQGMDIEQQRSLPSLATRTLIEAVRLDPDLIARAAANARAVYGTALK